MKKIILVSICSIFTLSLLVLPVLADEATGTNTNVNTNVASAAAILTCVQTAVEKRDAAIIAAFDTFSAAAKNLLTVRKDELVAAWALTDAKARRLAIKAAWAKYSKGLKEARDAFKKTKKSAWTQWNKDRKACRASAGDDKGAEGYDAGL